MHLGSNIRPDDSLQLRLLDVQTTKEVRRLVGHNWPIRHVAFSPDGRRALSASDDQTIRVWDVKSGKELVRFDRHKSRKPGLGTVINCVAVSPDGRRALSGAGGAETTMRLWEIESGKELRRFEFPQVNAVAFSPDGRLALSGCGYGESPKTCVMQLWDLDSGRELRRFEGHRGGVTSVGFSPDGRHALSTHGKIISLWRLPD